MRIYLILRCKVNIHAIKRRNRINIFHIFKSNRKISFENHFMAVVVQAYMVGQGAEHFQHGGKCNSNWRTMFQRLESGFNWVSHFLWGTMVQFWKTPSNRAIFKSSESFKNVSMCEIKDKPAFQKSNRPQFESFKLVLTGSYKFRRSVCHPFSIQAFQFIVFVVDAVIFSTTSNSTSFR